MAIEPWRKARVIRLLDETPNTRRFFMEVPEIDKFDFKPGQFVTLDLPIHEKPNKRWRSYSIASWPDGTNKYELVIVLDVNGAGTPYLFKEAGVDFELTYRGPQGVFTLKDPIDHDLFFICTGTGIAPFRSMLNHIKIHNIPHKNIYLIFGCRKKEDLLYYDEMKQLASDMPGINYIPTLSREEWEGRSGYVHAIYEELCADHQPAEFFICGWRGMIDEAKKRIHDLGYDKKDIHQEIYG